MSDWLKREALKILLGDQVIYKIYFKGSIQLTSKEKPDKKMLEENFISKGMKGISKIEITKIQKVA